LDSDEKSYDPVELEEKKFNLIASTGYIFTIVIK